ncbi:hypothetical protein FACS189468_1490 [Spirochaetia bacterium]|nr:hypothetical protein FACS189468_1490 [Spirochaetia bacterium]
MGKMNRQGPLIRRRGFFIPILLCALMLQSCIGVASDITLRRDGSGTINLEYRIASGLESLGKLDGNEGWPPIPVGRADFERSVSRIPGMKLASFSSARQGEDLVNTVKLEFAAIEALIAFLDASGQRAALSQKDGTYRLLLDFGAPESAGDTSEFMALARQALEGYSFTFRLKLPGPAAMAWFDGEGRPLAAPSAGKAGLNGGTVEFSSPMADLVSAKQAMRLEVQW